MKALNHVIFIAMLTAVLFGGFVGTLWLVTR